jgi:hypothetical protein
MPKYPNIKVKLIGNDGNAFAILGAVQKALKMNKVPKVEVDQFFSDATSGDYDHLLSTINEWVTIR